jgi:hypothetical protein
MDGTAAMQKEKPSFQPIPNWNLPRLIVAAPSTITASSTVAPAGIAGAARTGCITRRAMRIV